MSADPDQVMRILEIRGVDVRLSDGALQYRHRHRSLNDEDIAFVQHNRDALIDHLAEADWLAETVTNVLALSETEYQQWRREVLAGNDDADLDRHDREALRRVTAIREAKEASAEMEAA